MLIIPTVHALSGVKRIEAAVNAYHSDVRGAISVIDAGAMTDPVGMVLSQVNHQILREDASHPFRAVMEIARLGRQELVQAFAPSGSNFTVTPEQHRKVLSEAHAAWVQGVDPQQQARAHTIIDGFKGDWIPVDRADSVYEKLTVDLAAERMRLLNDIGYMKPATYETHQTLLDDIGLRLSQSAEVMKDKLNLAAIDLVKQSNPRSSITTTAAQADDLHLSSDLSGRDHSTLEPGSSWMH